MAQHQITYTCGHVGIERFYGKHENSIEKIKYAESKLCPECFEKQNDIKNEVGLKYLIENNIPPFTKGTIKQNSWANNIVAQYLGIVNEIKLLVKDENNNYYPEFKEIEEKLENLFQGIEVELKFNTDPINWIEKRAKYLRKTNLLLLDLKKRTEK